MNLRVRIAVISLACGLTIVAVFQIKRLENVVDEQSRQRKSDNSQLPQVNGPEMQLYEIQSKFTNSYMSLGSATVFVVTMTLI